MIKRCPQHGFFRGECCHCGEQGQLMLEEDNTERLGRLIAGVLRHFPHDLGLVIDSCGWVNLIDLSQAIRARYPWSNQLLIMALAQSDPKNRYEIQDDKIRARYGHSVDVDLDYPLNDLPCLYYGASEEEADRILEVGLKSANQRYVHLSIAPERAWHVGSFRTNNPRVIKIDAQAAQEEGVVIMKVSEEIMISEEVPSQFLSLLSSEDISI